MDVEVIARALEAPEMRRFEQQVAILCRKLGIPPPQWLREPKPPAGDPGGGS